MAKTFQWLSERLAAQGINVRLPAAPQATLIAHALGGRPDNLPTAISIGRIDLAKVLAPTSNSFVNDRRIALRLLPPPILAPGAAPGGAPVSQPPAGGVPVSLDWRNRFGANWITTVRDQGGCGSCWAFTGTALVEAMLRIETGYWARLSEGDLHDGVGSKCADGNNLGAVSDFLAGKGLADPGCWPYHQDDAPYKPSSDRNGRTVRMPAFTWVGDSAQQKQWLDSSGPLATWFDVYEDFDGYSGGYVYKRSTDPSNQERGGHFLLVVGYDDGQKAWICKNSWGTGWGDHGYVLVGYGEAGIDDYAKAGLTGLNPDPWTKRRLSNGGLYESGNGAMHRNLEVASAGHSGAVTHRWRDGPPSWTWNTSAQFANDAAACPTMRGTTYDRNLEMIYLTRGGRLHHWWRAGGGGNWADGGVFGPANCAGVPGFVQGDYNAPGNFEVVVRLADGKLKHLYRDNAPPWTWHEGPAFGSGIALSGATLVQGDYLQNGHGNLELVAVRGDGTMQHFWRTESDLVWHAGVTFGSGIGSAPVMIQGQYGMANEGGPNGNFELVVSVQGSLQHWWRDNASGSMAWRMSATFGSNIAAAVGLCQGSWGMNLEVIALRTDGQLQHFFRDGAGWHNGPIIGAA